MMQAEKYIRQFAEVSLSDVPEVGGKNASLGEMTGKLSAHGIRVPDGFAVTATAFRAFISHNHIGNDLAQSLGSLKSDLSNLREVGSACRALIMRSRFPVGMREAITAAHRELMKGSNATVAVRSSATAEDLPGASFAGQHDSFVNVGADSLIEACLKCYASLYNDRAIKYRVQKGFPHMSVALSIGVQKMVRSDLGSAGVAFTVEPETGFGNFIYITGVWGLGESIVQGAVIPDEFFLFKPALAGGFDPLVRRVCGAKTSMMTFADNAQGSVTVDTPGEKRDRFVLDAAEVTTLGKWCLAIESQYGMPMDIEWAKDGESGQIFIVQARPMTAHQKPSASFTNFRLKQKGTVLATGNAVGRSIVSGVARILQSPAEGDRLHEGEILVADTTSPDWNIVMRKASVIVTNKGGRTSHASIVARELGLSAIVGAGNATTAVHDGDIITVSCAEGEVGYIYRGKLEWEEQVVHAGAIRLPHTAPMLILADPSQALRLSFYPNSGVGLLRMEFIVTGAVKVHPMALVKFSEVKNDTVRREVTLLTRHYPVMTDYFVEKLAEGIGMVAAAFYPKPVILRMSDFKTNEYAGLLGGRQFEPEEENPMLGFRGASRYYHELYREGFRLECEAVKVVRDRMGLKNVKLMIPFCRTVEEGRRVVDLMSEFGLKRGDDDLEIYVMAEIPSNVILAEQFAEVFDGFSIGSNDLTQLTLGIDRDSQLVQSLFSEKNEAAMWMIATMIRKARKAGRKIGLCGQAPSDYPEFARFLVEEGIDSISFTPDALLNGIANIQAAEQALASSPVHKPQKMWDVIE